MKERPVIFSGPMVKAILDGKKTMTRRVIKNKLADSPCNVRWLESNDFPEVYGAGGVWLPLTCPYGKPGDRLWVRETWKDGITKKGKGCVAYKADLAGFYALHDCGGDGDFVCLGNKCEPWIQEGERWKPSIHMPRLKSRITLEITDVRVERLQEIIPADIAKEGCPYRYSGTDPENAPDWIGWYRTLWDSLSKDKQFGWDANPWVFVVSFNRI